MGRSARQVRAQSRQSELRRRPEGEGAAIGNLVSKELGRKEDGSLISTCTHQPTRFARLNPRIARLLNPRINIRATFASIRARGSTSPHRARNTPRGMQASTWWRVKRVPGCATTRLAVLESDTRRIKRAADFACCRAHHIVPTSAPLSLTVSRSLGPRAQ